MKPDPANEIPQYSVYWWDQEGHQHTEMRWKFPKTCADACKRLTTGPAAALGFVERVIITDGGDSIVFEWKKGKGITWPTKEQMENHRRGKHVEEDQTDTSDED